jgi:hypothetical protein
MPYYNVKISKCQNFGNFGPLIEHSPHWINFTLPTFISENNRYFISLYKIGTKLLHLTWEKKVKCKTSHRKSEEKGEFGSPWSESLRFKCGTPIIFGPCNDMK